MLTTVPPFYRGAQESKDFMHCCRSSPLSFRMWRFPVCHVLFRWPCERYHRDSVCICCLLQLHKMAFPDPAWYLICQDQGTNKWRSEPLGSAERDHTNCHCIYKHLHNEKVTGHSYGTSPYFVARRALVPPFCHYSYHVFVHERPASHFNQVSCAYACCNAP